MECVIGMSLFEVECVIGMSLKVWNYVYFTIFSYVHMACGISHITQSCSFSWSICEPHLAVTCIDVCGIVTVRRERTASLDTLILIMTRVCVCVCVNEVEHNVFSVNISPS